MSEAVDLNQALRSASEGDLAALDVILPLVYDELRRLAQSHLKDERQDHTLQATALVHEAYLKMIDQTRVQWQDRAHFFALASQAIRRVLVDHARGRNRKKRVGQRQKLSLNDGLMEESHDDEATGLDLIDLDQALEALAMEHPEKARIVEMRFFGGLTTEECADVLNVTTRTVERHWAYARAWLYREIGGDDTE